MGTSILLGKPNKLRGNDLRWTSILSRGLSGNTPGCFMLQKPGISSGRYEPVGSKIFFFIKHEQFDFSLVVNGKSIERKVFSSIYL